ncbi:hypothetical protein ETB97_006754 [Aspergillus alliaceus]|uniref:Cell wall protein n=1 Tax=Petromyces alliaceus TaxID=209559 RepID=A0A8H5ZX99_PETAA|nr:hypothetical protein ETB97_006754 [Aspergillus burnettii]
MIFSKPTLLAISTLCTVWPVLAATNLAHSISDMDRLTTAITAAKSSLDNYHGGKAAAIPVSSSIYQAKNAAQAARKSLTSGDPLTTDEATKYYEAYARMCPELLDAINAGTEKAPLLKQAGVAPLSRKLVQGLQDEKLQFEKAAQAQVPPEVFNKATPCLDQVSHAFDEVQGALQD